MYILNTDFKIDLSSFGIKNLMYPLRSYQILQNLGSKINNKNFIKFNNDYYLSLIDLRLAHSSSYIQRLYFNLLNELSFAYNQEPKTFINEEDFINDIYQACASVIKASDLTLDLNSCFLLQCYAGAHHARHDFGSGFCVINDIAICAKKLIKEKKAKKVLILDLDAHFGDGTAEICSKESDIYTYSIHQKNQWPFFTNLPIIFSDKDVHLDNCSGKYYLNALYSSLKDVFFENNFDFCIVVDGADVWEFDEIKSSQDIKLTEKEVLERDLMVYDFLTKNSVKNLWLMSGGYGKESYKIHLNLIKEFLK